MSRNWFVLIEPASGLSQMTQCPAPFLHLPSAAGSSLISISDQAIRSSWLLRSTIRDLLAEGRNKIVLNLGDVNYIDSSGIGELVTGFTTVKKSGGDLKLLHLTKKVHDILQLTKLFTVFEVFSDENVVIQSFK